MAALPGPSPGQWGSVLGWVRRQHVWAHMCEDMHSLQLLPLLPLRLRRAAWLPTSAPICSNHAYSWAPATASATA